MFRPVILEENQKSCVDSWFKSCLQYGHFLGGGNPGVGKTPCLIALVQMLSAHHQQPVFLCVVGPAASVRPSTSKVKSEIPVSPWEREARRYNYEDCYITTYETIRGKSDKATKESSIVLKRVCGEFKDLDGADLLQRYDYYKDDVSQENEFYTELIQESNAYADNFEPYEFRDVQHAWEYSRDSGLIEKLDLINIQAYKRGEYKYDSIYSPTMAWMKFCEDNIVMVVFDEAHAAKNDTQQNRSCAALVRGIRRAYNIKNKTASYFGTLTATPLNKAGHTNKYFKFCGRTDPVAELDMFVSAGAVSSQICYVEALNYNKTKAREIGQEFKIFAAKNVLKQTKNAREAELIASLWIDCVLDATHSSVPDITIKVLCNGFFDITNPKDLAEIESAHLLLLEADKFKKLGSGGIALAKQNESTRLAENGMVRKLAQRAFKHYSEDIDFHVILGFNYIKNVKRAHKYLIQMGVKPREMGMISGDEQDDENSRSAKVRQEDKSRYVRDFQVKRTFRIIIMTIKSGGQSISLHAQIACKKRFLYMVMGNDITAEEQFGGRGARFGNQSVAEVYICYPKTFGPDALRLYEGNQTKSAFMRRALEADSNKSLTEKERYIRRSNIKLPGEYDRYFEPPSAEFEDRAYLWDNPNWTETEDYVGMYPPPKEHGFVNTNNKEGRRLYKDTKFMIDYVQSIWDQDLPKDSVAGIFFKHNPDKYFNQFPPELFPNVTVLQEIP